MINLTPTEMMAKHIQTATTLYGKDYMNDPSYITSRFKELFDIQYSHLISSIN